MKELSKIKEHYDFSFDARQLGLILLGVFAVTALVFVLGVSVGIQWERKKAEGEGKAANAGLQPAVQAPQLAVAVAPPVPPPQPAPPAPPVMQAVTAPAPKAEKLDLTFPKVLTSNTKKTAPLVPEKKETGPSGRYTVQAGAYKAKGAAQLSADKLKKKGYDARVYKASGKGDSYPYKVRVGRFKARDEAAQAAKKLKASERVSPFVAQEE